MLTTKGGGLTQAQILALIAANAAPLAHKTQHQDGGSDEITVQGLAGVLTAEQLSSWAGVSGKPTTFTPATHNTSHQLAGGDALDLTGLVGSHKVFQSTFTRDTSIASGTQAITGVGFQPKHVIIHASIDSTLAVSFGIEASGSHKSTFYNGTGLWYSNPNSSILLVITAGTTAYSGYISSLDTDGFTITWSKTGSMTGTANIQYWAFF